MPQWDFLNFIAEQARRYPGFQPRMEAEATGLIEESGRVTGVRAKTPRGSLEIRADLWSARTGAIRSIREQAGLEVDESRRADGRAVDAPFAASRAIPAQALGRVDAGRILVMLDRGDYWQCAFIIRKGGLTKFAGAGLPPFPRRHRAIAPFLRDRVDELQGLGRRSSF